MAEKREVLLTTACRYACAAARKSTPPPATKRLARILAACRQQGSVKDDHAALVLVTRKHSAVAKHAPAAHHAQSSVRNVLRLHHQTILFKGRASYAVAPLPLLTFATTCRSTESRSTCTRSHSTQEAGTRQSTC